jgi:hypothetical protein
MQDNDISGLNESVLSGQPFVWDDNLVMDQQLNAAFAATNTRYSTDVSPLGSVYYVVNNGGAIVPNNSDNPYTPPSQNSYQMVLSTSYTSNMDGKTVLSPLDINGNSLAGFDIVQIEKEIKPLKANQFVWNKPQGVLTLVNGVTLDDTETLFILYSKIVS